VRVEQVNDAADPRVADYRGVRDPEWLRQRRRFVAESRQVIEILLTRDDLEVESLLLTAAAHRALEPRLGRSRVPVAYVVESDLLREIGGHAFHQGALAVARRSEDERLDQLLARLAPRARLVALEHVTNPDNVGSIFRNALAFGADGVLLSSRCAHPFYRKSLRTSTGAALRVPFAIEGDWTEALEELRRAGFVRAALTPDPDAESLVKAAPSLRGHEGDGLSARTLAGCDRRVRISMAAGVDSVNVATASGIALHELAGL
jgi:tRNA G18 (ribose-2'-O)-methylase SpoU